SAQDEGSNATGQQLAAFVAASLFDGPSKQVVESFFIRQKTGQQEMEQRPEFAQVIFHRRSGQAKVMAGLELAGDLGVDGFGILDELGLVEDDVVKFVLEQHGL